MFLYLLNHKKLYTLNQHNFLPVRNDIICRGVKRYQWDVLPFTVKHMMTDTEWGFKLMINSYCIYIAGIHVVSM